jgi:hypothetical protein
MWQPNSERPKFQSTTIIFHRHDNPDPIVHNLRGLWEAEALHGVLVTLVQEHYEEGFSHTCEVLWQDGKETWGQECNLVLEWDRP